jgi:hypothetical protein
MPLSHSPLRILISLTWQFGPLLLGVGLWGWCLAAFATPFPLVLFTGLVVAYLIAVGPSGIVPASAWISLLITLVVALDLFPPFWPNSLPYKHWAMTVLLLWGLSLAIVYLLARQGERLQQSPGALVGRVITISVLYLALQAGGLVYQAGWTGFLGPT